MKHLVVIFCSLIALSANAGQDPGVIKIGGFFNLTGGMSSIDLPAYNGAKLAAKIINQKGGILEGKRIELMPFDTKTDVDSTVNAAEKGISEGIIAGLGYGDTGYVLKVGPVFQKKGIPFVTSGATDPDLPGKIGSCLFMITFGDDDQAFAMADFALKSMKFDQTAVLTNASMEYTQLLAGFFKEGYKEKGGRIVFESDFQAEQKDFSTIAEKLKQLSPQPGAIFISGVPEDAVPIITALRKRGITAPVLSGDGFDTDLLTSLPAEYASDIYFSTHCFRGETRPEVVSFIQEYRKEYGKEPENAFAALGFDALNLIADAIHRAGSADPTALEKSLNETRGFKAITGAISHSRTGRAPVKPVSIVGLKKGEYRVMETIIP